MNTESIEYFRDISSLPESISVAAALGRIVDGVGFRFYWATESLLADTYLFKPGEDRWTIGDTISHIWDTAGWIARSLGLGKTEKPSDPGELRNEVLNLLYAIRKHFMSLYDEDLPGLSIHNQPFWNYIHGPLEDMLSHVGAIDNMRRTAGDYPCEPQFFYGKPPKE